jgi:hypothetical protein
MTTVTHPNYHTYYTSMLFLVASWRTAGCWLQTWLSLLAVISTLHHAKFFDSYRGKRVVQMLDRGIAHFIAVRCLFVAASVPFNIWTFRYLLTFYGSFVYCSLLYHTILRNFEGIHTLHSSIHIFGIIGILSLHRVAYQATDGHCVPW